MVMFLYKYGRAITIALIFVVIVFGIVSFSGRDQSTFGGFSVDREDVIGTNASPVDFSGFGTASSTVYFPTGGTTDVLDINIRAVAASGTPTVALTVEKSSDANCTLGNTAWFDASSPLPSAGAADLGTGTTTYTWTPAASEGKSLQFANWNAKCGKIILGSASTTIWVEVFLKELR